MAGLVSPGLYNRQRIRVRDKQGYVEILYHCLTFSKEPGIIRSISRSDRSRQEVS